MDEGEALRLLLRQLRGAYSGERAAGLAYRGHGNSLRDPEERARVRTIEDEEWHHRRLVGDMLTGLGAGPDRGRELRAWLTGQTLGVLCHVSGWFAPMYGAGRLERRNVKEYEDAAQFARACGRPGLVDCLLTMAEVEWEHERYFREKAAQSVWSRLVPLWPPLPPKESIRIRFAKAEALPTAVLGSIPVL